MSKNATQSNRNGSANRPVSIESLESRCLLSVTVAAFHPSPAMRHADAPPAVVQPASHAQHRHGPQASPRHHGMAFKGYSTNHNQTLLRR